MNISLDAVMSRRSVRSYHRTPLLGKSRQDVHKILDKENVGPFGSTSRFQLIDKQEYVCKEMKLGTYGIIHGARNFIIGAIPSLNSRNLVDYGYIMEKKILAATDLNLGTCWLGGTFNRKDFSKLIDLKKGEIIPAITPVGTSSKKSILERVICGIVRSAKRKSFEHLFFEGNVHTPIQVESTGKEFLPLKMVQKAPSTENLQPWRIIRLDNVYHFYLKREHVIEEALDTVDLQMVDMGIALCHFELGSMEKGMYGRWIESSTPPDGEGLEYILSWEVF